MAAPSFPPLFRLLRGDQDKIRQVLAVFERVTRDDMAQLDQAFARQDWAAVRELAHKAKSGCMQLGEVAAAEALVVLERTRFADTADEAGTRAFAHAHDQLGLVLARVADYLAAEPPGADAPNPGGTHARILIADDHPVILFALTEMLKSVFLARPVEVVTVTDGDELLQRLASGTWDYLVLDLHMPGQRQGLSLLRAALAAQPGLRIMVYTGSVHASLAQAALDQGARAYVSKASPPEASIRGLQAMVAGETFMDPGIDLDEARQHPWNRLTPGERTVMIALARGESLQAIALESNRSYKTVTTHKYNALRKLKLRSKHEIGRYLVENGLGYVLE